MTRRLHAALLAAAVAAPLLVLAPSPAAASPETIKRSISNLVLFPVDLALSPYVATRAVIQNWRSSGDTDAVKYAYIAPGIPWGISVNMGASVLRGVAGALEFLPGLVLIPFEADMQPLYDLSLNNAALYSTGEEAPVTVRLGVDYISPSSY